MDISAIDKNFSFESTIDREGLVYHDVRKPPFRFYGLHEPLNATRPFHRLPEDVAEATSPGVKVLNFHTAGGRLTFSTNSPFIVIRCETAGNICPMAHMALSGSQGFDLYRMDDDGKITFQCALMSPTDRIGKVGFEVLKELPKDGKVRQYVLNFPLYGTVKNLAIGLHEGAVLGEGAPYKYGERPVLFYGSSITQGGCASRPGSCYQALLTQEFGFDYINLGFSGSAKGEDAMINYLASLDPMIFVCDYDHNAPTADHLQATLPKLYRVFREAHPDTPFIFVSAPNMDTGKAKHDIVENTAREAIEGGDKNAYFVDGAHMFDDMKPFTCTVDGCHPTDLGFFGMYRSIAKPIREILAKM